MSSSSSSASSGHGHRGGGGEQRIFAAAAREAASSSNHNQPSVTNHPINSAHFEEHHRQQHSSALVDSSSSSSTSNWMESVWAPPNLLNIIAGDELDGSSPLGGDFSCAEQILHHHSHQPPHDGNDGSNFHHSSTSSAHHSQCHLEQISPHLLKRPGPIRQQQQFGMDSGADFYQTGPNEEECQRRLVVLRQPEEQHRARYASEGSRGAIKDRSGSSFCAIQLIGHYRPTRVELFAAERDCQGNLLLHSQYKLIPVTGKSSTITPCKRIVAEDGSERLEIMLRPENRMIGILDCIGIMKICSYGSTEAKRQKRRKRKATDFGTEEEQQIQDQPNSVFIVARALVPLHPASGQPADALDEPSSMSPLLLEAVTESIRCVQQLGAPDVLKMSAESSPAAGGVELFLIGRNFDPKEIKVLFREYRNDGSLGWSAEAAIDRRFLHQCHLVCLVPPYHCLFRGATVSVTVICGAKQSHPMNFHYSACEREDDDWRPPSTGSCAPLVQARIGIGTVQQRSVVRQEDTIGQCFPSSHSTGRSTIQSQAANYRPY